MYDLYQSNKDDSARFILGVHGNNKLFVIGLNPSTANKEKSDTTVAKVQTVAKNNNFDGFVMLNLYPLRSTNPIGLPDIANTQLRETNIQKIISIAKDESSPVFWSAWGGGIAIRPYLIQSLKELVTEVQKVGGSWLNYGELTQDGHPRHPSRLSYAWEFSEFDIANYVKNLT